MAARTRCDDCGSSDGLATYDSHTYCFSCNKKTFEKDLFAPSTKSMGTPTDSGLMPKEAIQYLTKYFRDGETVDCYWTKEYQRLAFVYTTEHGEQLGAWMRALRGEEPKWLYAGESKNLYTWLIRHGEVPTNSVILVEDVLSAIKCSKFYDTICLGGTRISGSMVHTIMSYENIILFLDGDAAGKDAARRARDQFKLLKPLSIIRAKKDPKDFTYEELGAILKVSDK